MANPKRRHSKQRKALRRTFYKLKPVNMSYCPHCRSKVLPHRVCPQCGQYKGRQVIEIKEKTKKKQ